MFSLQSIMSRNILPVPNFSWFLHITTYPLICIFVVDTISPRMNFNETNKNVWKVNLRPHKLLSHVKSTHIENCLLSKLEEAINKIIISTNHQ